MNLEEVDYGPENHNKSNNNSTHANKTSNISKNPNCGKESHTPHKIAPISRDHHYGDRAFPFFFLHTLLI